MRTSAPRLSTEMNAASSTSPSPSTSFTLLYFSFKKARLKLPPSTTLSGWLDMNSCGSTHCTVPNPPTK